MNVVVLQGTLARPAELRLLPSGDSLVGLEVTVRCPGRAAESVPVVWPDAPAAAAHLDVGEGVVVVGRVRRRFFRSGGLTQSRTEVVAQVVVETRKTKRAQTIVAQAAAQLTDYGAH